MSSPAEIIRAAITAGGVGSIPGVSVAPLMGAWPVYVGSLPDAPDNAACVYDTAGQIDGRIMRTGETVIHPGWMIRVRGTDHPTAHAKIREIQKLLDGFHNFDVAVDATDYTIIAITQNAGILSMGQETDIRRRNNFSLNGTITYREVP